MMDVARRFQIFYSKQRREGEKEARRLMLLKYGIELAEGLARLSGKVDAKEVYKELTELIEEKIKLANELELLEENGDEEAPVEEVAVTEED